MFTPLGLDHIVLRVSDQDASRRFYVDVLGCTLDHVNEAASLVQLRFGDHLIDLLPAEATDHDSAKGPPNQARGLDHFCLSIACDDLEKVATELQRQDVALMGGVVQRRGAYGSGPSLYIRDPDGYQIELKPR